MPNIRVTKTRAEKLKKLLDTRGLDRRPKSFREQDQNVIIENASDDGSEIPAFACVQPFECTFERNIFIVKVKKWDGKYFGQLFFNSHNKIKFGDRGVIQKGPLYTAYFFDPDPETDGRKMYAPAADEWFVVPGDGQFEGLGIAKYSDELYCLYPGPPELVRFILTENCNTCEDAKANIISPIECIETEEITVIDTIGLCKLAFSGPFETFAPIGSMGFARRVALDVYEIVNIAVGCCDDEFDCPQIPGVPMGIIGVGADTIKWVLGFDEDGCLVRVPVGDCCTEEEEEPPAEGKPPE